jgi:hypothetical protein
MYLWRFLSPLKKDYKCSDEQWPKSDVCKCDRGSFVMCESDLVVAPGDEADERLKMSSKTKDNVRGSCC